MVSAFVVFGVAVVNSVVCFVDLLSVGETGVFLLKFPGVVEEFGFVVTLEGVDGGKALAELVVGA